MKLIPRDTKTRFFSVPRRKLVIDEPCRSRLLAISRQRQCPTFNPGRAGSSVTFPFLKNAGRKKKQSMQLEHSKRDSHHEETREPILSPSPRDPISVEREFLDGRGCASSGEAELAPVHVRETAWVDIQPCTPPPSTTPSSLAHLSPFLRFPLRSPTPRADQFLPLDEGRRWTPRG